MKKHRGVFLAMGLAALMGLMASEARAANLVLTVYAGSGTSGAVIYSQTGGANTLNAAVGALDTALAADGYSAYSFSSLGASSNNPGSTVNGYVLVTGNMSVYGTGTGAGSPITVVVSEGSFFSPSYGAGNMLVDQGQSNYADTGTSSTTTDQGTFSSSSPTVNVSTTPFTLPAPAGGSGIVQNSASTPLPTYSTPYTLTSQSVLSVTPGPGVTATSPGSVGITNKVLVSAAIPEPASIVMMLTGMPLPLVVVGLLRRRRAAA